MKPTLSLLLLVLFPYLVFGQFGESIRTGRPRQSHGPFTVGKKVFQIQTGFQYIEEQDEVSETKVLRESTTLRFGVLERVEISGVVTWQMDDQRENGREISRRGISNTQIGGRVNLLQQNGLIPNVALQGRLLLRAQSAEFRRSQVGSRFTLATGHRLSKRFTVVSTWGLTWRGDQSGPTASYVFSLIGRPAPRIKGFVETYGTFDDPTNKYDAGIAYLLNNDLQVDLTGGWHREEGVREWFLDAGVSWRIVWRD